VEPDGPIEGVLLDIEGTTTPISFVYDILFPYAESRLETVCSRAGTSMEIADAVDRLRREYRLEAESGLTLPLFGNGAPYARFLMERDRKSTGLKALQGLIWREGYENGEIRGKVFEDVPRAFRRWTSAGLRLRIFSSGSVLAQKLLFGKSEFGDLTGFLEGFHDTTTGPKREAESYRRIADSFGSPPDRVLFLSDIAEELDAAREANMRTALTVRPGNKPVDSTGHTPRSSFDDLDPLLGRPKSAG